MGFNHYTTRITGKGNYSMDDKPSFEKDQNLQYYVNSSNTINTMGWETVPEGFYNILMYITTRYDKVPIYVTESGYAESGLQDLGRIRYLKVS